MKVEMQCLEHAFQSLCRFYENQSFKAIGSRIDKPLVLEISMLMGCNTEWMVHPALIVALAVIANRAQTSTLSAERLNSITPPKRQRDGSHSLAD